MKNIRKLSVNHNLGIFCPATVGLIPCLLCPRLTVLLIHQTAVSERNHPEIFERSIVYVDEDDNWGEWDWRSPRNRVEIEDMQTVTDPAQTMYGVLDDRRMVVRCRRITGF